MKATDKATLFHQNTERALAGVKAYAASDPALARGLAEGYDVADKCAEMFVDRLLESIESDEAIAGRVSDVLVEHESAFALAEASERKAPRMGSFVVSDAVLHITNRIGTAFIGALENPHGLFCVDVSRIQRFKPIATDMTPRTVVLVHVNSVLASVRERVIVVNCE
jgi:hypothetical protein